MEGRFGRAMSKLLDMTSRAPHCLIHFDPHLGNLSLNRDGQVVLVDWQFFRVGHWSHDVSYFISSALTPEHRRAWERDLLEYYLERLQAHGGRAPSFDDAWQYYVAGQLYGVFSWVCTQLEMQTLETIYTLLGRHLAAVADLGTLDLLDWKDRG
jgi:aminoglycoside phosphotransferase (APT) family kinase protein